MKDYHYFNSDGEREFTEVPEQYTEKAMYVTKKMREMVKNYFENESGNKSLFSLHDIEIVLQYACDLEHVISVLQELRNMRENGHDMCLEDSVYGISVMNQVKCLSKKAKQLWIEMNKSKRDDFNPFFKEMGLADLLKDLDLSSSMEQYVTGAWMIYDKVMAWLPSCTKAFDEAAIFFSRDEGIYTKLFMDGYKDYWFMNKEGFSEAILDGLYKKETFGEKILSYGQQPRPEDWGRALELKLSKLKEDSTFSFIERFHRANSLFKLTDPPNLPDVVRNRITMSFNSGLVDDDSYDRMIQQFYRHVTEINILKQKMSEENIVEKPHPHHFPPHMNYHQGERILVQLKEKKFVKGNTEPQNFMYLMGCTDERPTDVKPIVWLKNKQLLREMLELWFAKLLEEKSFTKAKMADICSQVFVDDKGEMIHLAKNKATLSADSDDLKKIFATI